MKTLISVSAAVALVAGAASAADLPGRAAPAMFVPPPAFSWTGIYIGTHTAYTFTDTQRITSTGNNAFANAIIAAGVSPGSVSNQQSRIANFGGGFGINYQLTPGAGFVIGAAFDADWTNIHKSGFVVGNPISLVVPAAPAGLRLINTYGQGLGYLATANARIGYAFDRFLVYATGGAAIGKVDYAVVGYFPNGTLEYSGSDGGNEIGYNFGGGIEYAIPSDSLLGRFNLLELVGIRLGGTTTIKAEYIHYDLGSRNVLVSVVPTSPFPTSSVARFHTEGNMVRAGFTYKFGG